MVEEKTLELKHEDFVLDMKLDHYGRRLATGSEDGTVRVFKRANSKEGWKEIASIRAESGVIRVSWAHPEFSSLLACSTDRTLIILEEEDESSLKALYTSNKFASPITAIDFGPRHLGLRLAVAMANGDVEIYSPGDSLRREWIQRHTFTFEPEQPTSEARPTLTTVFSWNRYPYDNRSMVVAHGTTAQFWRMDRERRKWKLATATTVISHARAINSIAWAPNMGRSFHLIATASSDGTVRIWSVKSQNKENGPSVLGNGPLAVELLQTLVHKPKYPHESIDTPCEVFRVEWNLTASCLSTTTSDGGVYLWTPNFKGEWTLQREIATDDS